MNSSSPSALDDYVAEVKSQLESGHAREHAYRPALQQLMASFADTLAVNDPKRSENGNPDFVFLKASNRDVILGYAEAKDITADLDKTIKTEQLRRYAGYEKLYLTNYLDFRFYQNGEEYERIVIGRLVQGSVVFDDTQFERLSHELQAFLERPPEHIRSGKRLALIMGGKARRIRDNVALYLADASDKNQELEKIYELMLQMLVHDLTTDKFADMYAQTLVYGLFVARYNDTTPESFDRGEARDLVPRSNPFLRHFFDHIVGPDFDTRLGHIVDELCEVFSVSDVKLLIQKHLKLFEIENEKDPIIHFYEDFLHEYDPAIRKQMGAYYTPIPVVRFIVRQVDDILKRDFGIAKGLADSSTITRQVDVGQEVELTRLSKTGKQVKYKTSIVDKQFHRVQILDPAVGTATFLNETIKHIAASFVGQEGQWPAYVRDHLLDRLHGFELMMAPYVIAHLKLGMTLQETGVAEFDKRIGVYLTNTLEEGIPRQQDLFNFGLAQAVSDESQAASEIKHERPIMIVMGNPPYSISSNNKSAYIENLVADYKKDLNERNIQPLSDDYIKFVRFAEEMVTKNGEGIVAMITNNSYLDGIIHRRMRQHLMQTFDKVYILDLHGNSKKKEVAPDGSKDENVFDIQQGVAIIIAMKNGQKNDDQLGEVYHTGLFGVRRHKFAELANELNFTKLDITAPSYYFIPKNIKLSTEYNEFISVRELMPIGDAGIKTHRDAFVIDFDKSALEQRIHDFYDLNTDELKQKYQLKENAGFRIADRQKRSVFDPSCLRQFYYRPFDIRWAYYSSQLMDRPREKTMHQLLGDDNMALVVSRQCHDDFKYIFMSNNITDINYIANAGLFGGGNVLPLYIYHDDGTRTANFNRKELDKLLTNIQPCCYVGEESDLEFPAEDMVVTALDVLDYLYGVLHSPSYREKYKEFLKTDFPRVPVPASQDEFFRYAGFGRRLRELHLMTSPTIDDCVTTFPTAGSNEVEKVSLDGDKVYINDAQYFGGVPELAWNFYIGGYQPAQKWLKDRKGRQLSSDDIAHYQRVIKVLLETAQIMAQIDAG